MSQRCAYDSRSDKPLLEFCLWVLVPNCKSLFCVHEQNIVWQTFRFFRLGIVDQSILPRHDGPDRSPSLRGSSTLWSHIVASGAEESCCLDSGHAAWLVATRGSKCSVSRVSTRRCNSQGKVQCNFVELLNCAYNLKLNDSQI